MLIVAYEVQEGEKPPLRSDGTVALNKDGNLITVSPASSSPRGRVALRLGQAFTQAFLPANFPASVTPDYLPFQIWDTVQALCSYVRGMAASQATLQGIGVGSAVATPAAAVLTFFFRDIIGLLTGVLFAAAQSRSFDANAKQWRFTADVANDIGLLVDLAAPAVPAAFLPLACLGAICRTITGVAGGATRMALTSHFALQDNAADIAAKEGSQETAVTLIGMFLGLGLTRLFAWNVAIAWIAFMGLTVIHVYANWKAMRCLRLTRLNPARLDILLENYTKHGRCPTPEEVARREGLMPPVVLSILAAATGVWAHRAAILIAPSLKELDRNERRLLSYTLQHPPYNSVATGVENRKEENAAKKYCIIPVKPCRDESSIRKVLVFLEPSTIASEDLITAYCLGRLTTLAPSHAKRWASNGGSSSFLAALRAAGWSCDRPALLQNSARLTWGDGHSLVFQGQKIE